MRILLVIPAEYKGAGWGGVMTYSLLFAKYAGNKHTVTILTPGEKNQTLRFNHAMIYKVAHHHLRVPLAEHLQQFFPIFADRIRWMIAVYNFVRRHPEFDIVESSEWGNSTLLVSLLTRTKTTVRPRKSQLQYYLDNKLPITLDIRLVNLLEILSISCASSVSSPTAFMLRTHPVVSLINRLRGIPVAVIPNAVDLHTPDYSAPFAFPYILSVGRLEYGKGQHVLLRAFARIAGNHPNMHLVYIGRDMPVWKSGLRVSYKQELISFIRSHKLDRRVIFLPQKTQAQLGRYYRHCICFCLPSRKHENHPFVLLDAVKWKKAAVASRTGGIPEILTHNKNGLLVEEDDVQGFANALDAVLNDSAMRKRMEQYNNTYRNTFDIQKTIRKLLHFYKKTLT